MLRTNRVERNGCGFFMCAGRLFLIFMRGTASLKALFSTAEGVIVLVAMLAVCIAMSIRNYFFYWNRDDAQEKL